MLLTYLQQLWSDDGIQVHFDQVESRGVYTHSRYESHHLFTKCIFKQDCEQSPLGSARWNAIACSSIQSRRSIGQARVWDDIYYHSPCWSSVDAVVFVASPSDESQSFIFCFIRVRYWNCSQNISREARPSYNSDPDYFQTILLIQFLNLRLHYQFFSLQKPSYSPELLLAANSCMFLHCQMCIWHWYEKYKHPITSSRHPPPLCTL